MPQVKSYQCVKSREESELQKICIQALNNTQTQGSFAQILSGLQKALEGLLIHPDYQKTVQHFLREWINRQEMSAYLQMAFLLNLTPSQLLRLNSFYQTPKLSLVLKTALPEIDVQNMLMTINQNLREQITEFQIEFAKDLAEKEKGDIPPLSLENLAQTFMQVEPLLLDHIFQDLYFVPPFTQLVQILDVGTDIGFFFEDVESSQAFISIFEAVSQNEESAIIIEDKEKDRPVSQEETSISNDVDQPDTTGISDSRQRSWAGRPISEQRTKTVALVRESTSFEEARGEIARSMNMNVSTDKLRRFIANEQERIGETITLKPSPEWEEGLTDEEKARIIVLVRESISFEEAKRKIARSMNMNVSTDKLRRFIANEQERTGETITLKPSPEWEEGLTDEEKARIVVLVRENTSLEEAKRKIARSMNMNVSTDKLRHFIANEQQRIGETIALKPTWEESLTDEEKARIVVLVRESTSFEETSRKIARSMNMNVSTDKLRRFIANEQERIGETITLKPSPEWEEGLTDKEKAIIVVLVRESTSFEEAKRKIARSMNMNVSTDKLRRFIANKQERTGETITLKPSPEWEEGLTDEEKAIIVVLVRESTSFEEAKRKIARSMNMNVSTDKLRRFIANEQQRIGETIELKPRLTWEESLTDEQKERIVALLRDSSTLNEAREKINRSMDMNVSKETLRIFIINERERTGQTIELKPRLTWEESLTDEQKERIVTLVRESTSFEDVKREMARSMDMNVSRSTLQIFIANEQKRTGQTIELKPRLTWEQGLTDEQRGRIVVLIRESTSFREARRKMARSMNMHVSKDKLRRFITNEQERTGEAITLKQSLTWEESLTDEQKERIVALIRESTSFEEAREKVNRSMNMNVSKDKLRRFIANKQERTGETITLKPRLDWEKSLTDEEKAKIVALIRESTNLEEARREIARSMNMNVSTDKLRRFITNGQERTGEAITLKRRLTWEESLTDEQKERIVALIRESTSFEEVRRKMARSMDMNVSRRSLRIFIANEEKRRGETIELKPRPE